MNELVEQVEKSLYNTLHYEFIKKNKKTGLHLSRNNG